MSAIRNASILAVAVSMTISAQVIALHRRTNLLSLLTQAKWPLLHILP